MARRARLSQRGVARATALNISTLWSGSPDAPASSSANGTRVDRERKQSRDDLVETSHISLSDRPPRLSADIVSKLLALTHWRFVVRPKSVPSMIGLLRIDLKDLGFIRQSTIPDEVLLVLIEEAYKRAAGRERDNLARYGRLYMEIEAIAGEIVAASEGNGNVDPRVRSILAFHRLV